jgi:hypothetical protein
MLKLRTLILTATSLLIVVLAIAPAAGAKASASCAPHGSHVVESSNQAVVYIRASSGGVAYYGCLRGSSAAPRKFATDASATDIWAEDSVSDVHLAGATVTWVVSHEPGSSCRYGNPCSPASRTAYTLSLTTGARQATAL